MALTLPCVVPVQPGHIVLTVESAPNVVTCWTTHPDGLRRPWQPGDLTYDPTSGTLTFTVDQDGDTICSIL